jgi:hypothetical protein
MALSSQLANLRRMDDETAPLSGAEVLLLIKALDAQIPFREAGNG